jgi:CRP/FNR family transcriptional regulator
VHEDAEKTIASTITTSKFDAPLEAVLAYLPVSSTTHYQKGETIYDPDHPSKSIYLVATGKVEISEVGENGRDVLMEILRPDELFGEAVFFDVPHRSERATVLESATLMSWTDLDIEDLIMKQPRLAIGLLQALTQRNAELTRRIKSSLFDNIGVRLAHSLIHFSERLGTREENGSVRLMPLTHELLSRHVGASRALVTHHMNRLREQGYLSYSRQGILVFCSALKSAICEHRFPTAEKSNQGIPRYLIPGIARQARS